jgi:hypothetical protein
MPAVTRLRLRALPEFPHQLLPLDESLQRQPSRLWRDQEHSTGATHEPPATEVDIVIDPCSANWTDARMRCESATLHSISRILANEAPTKR